MEVKIILSSHAKEMLPLRGITQEQVEKAIQKPDFTEKGKRESIVLIKQFGLLALRVIAHVENEQVFVITTHWIKTSRMKGARIS